MDADPVKLAEQLYNASDEQQARKLSNNLIDLIPSFTENSTENVLSKLSECVGDDKYWKRDIAGDISETIIIKLTKPENPLSSGIKHVIEQIKTLNFNGIEFIPSAIQVFVLAIVLAIFVMIWPYGLMPIIAGSMWKLIRLSRTRMKFKVNGLVDKMPYTMAIGIYLLLWLPFAILCLPFIVIGWIGNLFVSEK